jgi:hypothetical protein
MLFILVFYNHLKNMTLSIVFLLFYFSVEIGIEDMGFKKIHLTSMKSSILFWLITKTVLSTKKHICMVTNITSSSFHDKTSVI